MCILLYLKGKKNLFLFKRPSLERLSCRKHLLIQLSKTPKEVLLLTSLLSLKVVIRLSNYFCNDSFLNESAVAFDDVYWYGDEIQRLSVYILHSVDTNKYCIFLCQGLVKITNKFSFLWKAALGWPEIWQNISLMFNKSCRLWESVLKNLKISIGFNLKIKI